MPLYNWLIAHKKWAKAAGLVPDLVKAGFVDAAAGAALEADLIILQAEAAAAENQVAEAVKMAKRAFETAPDHMPALIAYATWLVALDKGQKAASFVYEHWAKMAHPELLAIYRKAEPKEATGKVNWVQKLYATAPNLKESHLAMAAVLVETKQEDAALKHLQSYIQPNHTDRRAAMLMAQLHADDVAVANDWLYKALHAPAPETWACHACGRHTSQREAQCAGCDRVGSQFWTGGNTDLVVAEAAQ
jgi:HemY protein